MTLAWYAAYGSNTDEERFRRYLVRCTQPAEPLDDRPFVIDLPLYFAGTSTTWGEGGVAFVGPERDDEPATLARAWLLPHDRVEEIKAMEGRWYDAWMECGELEGVPVVTFTGSAKREPVNPPAERYVRVVAKGLRHTHGLSEEQAAAYLAPRTNLPISTLLAWQSAGAGYQGTNE
jgi:hypothetical protein